MEEKDKAKELISKFTFYSIPENEQINNNPKQCALIAVAELINATKIANANVLEYSQYWQQVKIEIEKL